MQDLEPDKINALTSYNAIEAYKTDTVKPSDFKDFDLKTIKELTSSDMLEEYKNSAKINFTTDSEKA